MTRIWKHLFYALLYLSIGTACSPSADTGYTIRWTDKEEAILSVDKPSTYILWPIEEGAGECQVCLLGSASGEVNMDLRLARNRVDYWVPFELPKGKPVSLRVRNAGKEAVVWEELCLSDTFNTANTDAFRPIYHHTPLYGWMNDPNGMVYKDGEYHLYYQYNPYGSMWGNMHWGHSVSRDLINWEHKPVALARDTMGHIFSGSSVVDIQNTAGFGAGSIIAFYTSASDKNGQIQCLAYSRDQGDTFTKYAGNPILTPFDGLRDFRDPKVCWYEPEKKWIMVVSADKEIRFYSSKNLKEWTYMSAFGEGYGVQPSQFECPDFFELPVDGNPNLRKWVLVVNVNPGCLFGGSATEYFVGDFDGKTFTCDTPQEVTKWMDWGKDHYATVTFSNTPERVIAIPWMSNWQYANVVPTRQFRSANGLPRELHLYTEGSATYLASEPVRELTALRNGEVNRLPAFQVNGSFEAGTLLEKNEGAYELLLTLDPQQSKQAGFVLRNSKNESIDIQLDFAAGKLIMDRVNSGTVEFGNKSVPHAKEAHELRKTNAIHYVNDFALATWGKLPVANKYELRVFVDKCSIEIFVNGGKTAMTNLVFPAEPYNQWSFYGKGGSFKVEQATVYALSTSQSPIN